MKHISLRAGALVLGAVFISGTAFAQISINVNQYTVQSGGVTITANYQGTVDCCPDANIRWIQKVHLTDGAGNDKPVPGFPIPDFIDPQPGTPLSGLPDPPKNKADSLPWYEYTDDGGKNGDGSTKYLRGKGHNFGDMPTGWDAVKNGKPVYAPISFAAQTLLVCIDSNPVYAGYGKLKTPGKFCVLGGFSWGFTVMLSPDGKSLITRRMPLMGLKWSAGLQTGFNNSLNNPKGGPFSAWQMDGACECADDVTVKDPSGRTLTPEPSSFAALGIGISLLARRRRRKAA